MIRTMQLNEGVLNSIPKSREINAIALPCAAESVCSEYWKKGNDYLKRTATTKTRYKTDSVIVTDTPATDTDIAMALINIPNTKEEGIIWTILQLRCKDTKAGNALCEGEEATELLQNFKENLGG